MYIPDIATELIKLNHTQITANDTALIGKLEKLLNKIGGFSLQTKLIDVMVKGNHLSFDQERSIQSNALEVRKKHFAKKMEVTGMPLICIQHEIKKTEQYIQKDINAYIPGIGQVQQDIIKWDRRSVAFCSVCQDPDISLEDVLYFLLVTNYGEKDVFKFVVEEALHELSNGTASALFYSELKKLEKEYSQIKVEVNEQGSNIQSMPTSEVTGNNSDFTNDTKLQIQKLEWLCPPSVFGHIINELIDNGYVKKPTNSYAKDMQVYLSIFKIDTTPGTLEKEISSNTNSLTHANTVLLKLPHKNEVS